MQPADGVQAARQWRGSRIEGHFALGEAVTRLRAVCGGESRKALRIFRRPGLCRCGARLALGVLLDRFNHALQGGGRRRSNGRWERRSGAARLKENVAMTTRQALALIRRHGVVLEAARGPVPSLAEAIAGEPIPGSWWSHPKSHEIFAVTRAIRNRGDVLVCRLVKGKVTLVHRRLWPALVRAAGRLPLNRLSQLREVHMSSGRHVSKEVPFPVWVPSRVRAEARRLSEAAALAVLRVSGVSIEE